MAEVTVDQGSLTRAAKALESALQIATRPSTADAPPNVSDKQMRAEAKDQVKNAVRKVDECVKYANQQGMRAQVVWTDLSCKVLLWHHTIGKGETGEQLPDSLVGEGPTDLSKALAEEVGALKAEIADLKNAKKAEVLANADDKGGDHPDVPGLNVEVEETVE